MLSSLMHSVSAREVRQRHSRYRQVHALKMLEGNNGCSRNSCSKKQPVHWEWQTHCVLMDGNVLPGVRRCSCSAAYYLDVKVLGIQARDSAGHLPQEAVKSGCCGDCHGPFVVALHHNRCSSSECVLMDEVCCGVRSECFAVQSASPSVRLLS